MWPMDLARSTSSYPLEAAGAMDAAGSVEPYAAGGAGELVSRGSPMAVGSRTVTVSSSIISSSAGWRMSLTVGVIRCTGLG